MSDSGGRLHRCIRDLAALNALPSMCIGRSPEEALEIVLDALPTALGCELVHLTMPGTPPVKRCSIPSVVDESFATGTDGAAPIAVGDAGSFFLLDADIPMGKERGRLVAGRRAPLDPETDRALVRSAANLVGTTLESAHVLEGARRKDDFLAMLGHELRNPLAPILTAVELLGRHAAVDRERVVIERNTRHLARLVDDLLDISRVTRGHVELRSEVVMLTSVLERAIEMAAPIVAKHRHELRVGSGEDIALRGDPVRLAQVFGNLLTNAAKFTPPGGHIELTVERVGEQRVRVVVRDDGRGIEKPHLGRIFEPFVQVDREKDALRGGLGLGLAIVANLVDRHGGTIRAESAGRGRGAAFSVELPVVDRGLVAPPPSEPATSSARGGVRVLVVDDNADVAELLSEALALEGFETAVEYGAHAALARWRSFRPHAGVLDVGLPELDGYELARALRAEHGTAPTLIAATGYGQRRDRDAAAAAGFDCHFVKPVSVHELALVLDQRVVNVIRP